MGNGIEFGSVNVRTIRVATRISIDCDCSGHFFCICYDYESLIDRVLTGVKW